MAAQLYEMGKLSLGQAATLAGYEKREFAEILGSYGVSLFNYSADDVDNDMRNADVYSLRSSNLYTHREKKLHR